MINPSLYRQTVDFVQSSFKITYLMLMADICYLPVADISVESLLTGIDYGTLPSLCRHTTCVVRTPGNTLPIGAIALIGLVVSQLGRH